MRFRQTLFVLALILLCLVAVAIVASEVEAAGQKEPPTLGWSDGVATIKGPTSFQIAAFARADCPIYATISRDGVLEVYTCGASYGAKRSEWFQAISGIRKVVIVGPENEVCDFPVERKVVPSASIEVTD